jgi:GH15 family glucan-1,4-alpha-glucosidase
MLGHYTTSPSRNASRLYHTLQSHSTLARTSKNVPRGERAPPCHSVRRRGLATISLLGRWAVALKPTAIGQQELDRFLNVSRDVFREAGVASPRGRAVFATPPSGNYPYVYTRQLAVAIAGLCDLGAVDAARDYCRFLLRVQGQDGSWVQRYDAGGQPAEQVVQEDATALAVWALLSYVKAAGDDALVDVAREPIERATSYTIERSLNPYLYLIETTTSLHENEVSRGYEMWNNCAHAAAFALCHRVYGGERFRRLALMIRRSIGLLMVQENRFLRRLDERGYPDPRPDVSMMSPFFFGLWAPTERAVMNSAELIERTLWNVEIGGYVRYLPYSPVERSVIPGPWPHFTAWMAQYHYMIGNQDRAEAIVRWLFDNTVDGQLPETIMPAASIRRFAGEYRARLDADPPHVNPKEAVRSALRADIDRIERLSRHQEAVPANVPYVWAHVETLRALKRGGYVENWEAESTAHRSH